MSEQKNTVVECSVPERSRRDERIETTAELRVSNLNASYNKISILRDVSLSISQGEFVCLCGPNGAGKTTLLSVMAGVPDAGLKVTGDIRWLSSPKGVSKPPQTSVDIKTLSRRAAARLIAYMQQNEYSEWDFTVRDYVLQGRYAHTRWGNCSDTDYETVDSILTDLNLTQFATRTIHTLSGGEFQKIRLARALAQTPKFLLLDEPAANLDYVYEPHLMQLLADTAHNKNLGILAAVHDINLAARFADKIILLPPARTSDNSKTSGNSASSSPKKSVLYGTPSDIMNTENLKYTFGVDFECKEIKSFQSLQ